MLTTRNSAEANAELDELVHQLCYQSIRWSGLYAQLDNDAWDALAERLKGQVRAFVDEQIDNELARIESEKSQ